MNSLLDALGYIGSSLDKPGRAVRGLLAGRPGEVLAALPFSDALGLTDESNAVSGRGLLENYGLVAPKEDGEGFGLADALGIGTELALDPLNFVGGFGLGKLAKGNRLARESNAVRAGNLAHNARTEELIAKGAMPQEVAKATKVADEAGKPLATYHGTPHAFEQFDMAKMDPSGLYGPGIYTTADPAVASEYTGKGAAEGLQVAAGQEQALKDYAEKLFRKDSAARDALGRNYDRGWGYNVPPERGHLEPRLDQLARRADTAELVLQAIQAGNGIPEEVLAKDPSLSRYLEEAFAPRNVRKQFLDIRNPFDIDRAFPPDEARSLLVRALGEQGYEDSIRKVLPGEMMSGDELHNILAEGHGWDKSRANQSLQRLGFDAITHIGGGRVGNVPHQVYIGFDPKQVYRPLVAPALQEVPDYLNERRLSPLLAALGVDQGLSRSREAY